MNSLFRWHFWVCCHPEILLQWQHDVMTCPLHYLPNKKIYLSRITGWDSFGDMHVHLLGVTNYTHKINNTKFGTWKHFIQSQNRGTLVCGDLNYQLQLYLNFNWINNTKFLSTTGPKSRLQNRLLFHLSHKVTISNGRCPGWLSTLLSG